MIVHGLAPKTTESAVRAFVSDIGEVQDLIMYFDATGRVNTGHAVLVYRDH